MKVLTISGFFSLIRLSKQWIRTHSITRERKDSFKFSFKLWSCEGLRIKSQNKPFSKTVNWDTTAKESYQWNSQTWMWKKTQNYMCSVWLHTPAPEQMSFTCQWLSTKASNATYFVFCSMFSKPAFYKSIKHTLMCTNLHFLCLHVLLDLCGNDWA